MNAHAHLVSLGWAGTGHSLDSRPDSLPAYKQKGHRGLAYDPSRDPAKVGNTGVGLIKPLSISHRKARLGVGKKAHEPSSGTEWWLKGFESALGNIGKSESERSSGVSTPVGNGNTRFDSLGGKHGGLYGFFVRGQMMEGTIHEKSDQMVSRGTKRKSDGLDDPKQADSDFATSSDRSTEKKKRKNDKKAVSDFETTSAFIATSQQDDEKRRRKHKDTKPSELEQFAQIGQFLQAKEGLDPDTKRRKKDKTDQKRKSELADTALAEDRTGVDNDDNEPPVQETKEQRRERRRKRREEKEARRQVRLAAQQAANGVGEGQTKGTETPSSLTKEVKVKRRKSDPK